MSLCRMFIRQQSRNCLYYVLIQGSGLRIALIVKVACKLLIVTYEGHNCVLQSVTYEVTINLWFTCRTYTLIHSNYDFLWLIYFWITNNLPIIYFLWLQFTFHSYECYELEFYLRSWQLIQNMCKFKFYLWFPSLKLETFSKFEVIKNEKSWLFYAFIN